MGKVKIVIGIVISTALVVLVECGLVEREGGLELGYTYKAYRSC